MLVLSADRSRGVSEVSPLASQGVLLRQRGFAADAPIVEVRHPRRGHVNLANQQTQQRFPFPYEDVFSGLVAVLPEVGMTVKSQDKVLGRVTASAGMSLFSWGENIAIVVQALDEKATIVGIESSLKFGATWLAPTGIRRTSRTSSRD